jgi:hypothetical protein
MGANTAVIFKGRRAGLLTPDGLILSSTAIVDNDGPMNLVKNGHFELSTVGWIAYQNAAATAPLDAAGGSPVVTITRTTSSPLNGQGSGLLTKDAANRQGQGISYQAAVPVAANNQDLLISFDYLTSGGYTGSGAEYINIYAYDVTNATLITPQAIQLPAAPTGGTFQTVIAVPVTSAIRVAFHIAGTGAAAWNVRIDNVLLGKAGTPFTVAGRTALTSPDGLLLSNGAIIDNDGPINPIHNGHFEVSTSGWVTYADLPGPTPVNGIGGSPFVTFARDTTNPLTGTADGLITKDAANRQGEGVSYDFTIPEGFQSQQMTINMLTRGSVNYAGGGTEQVSVYVYDVTNSNLITPTSVVIDTSGRYQASFSTASNSTSYRLILHVATTGTLAWTLTIDEIRVLLADALGGANVTTAGFQTVQNKIFQNSYIQGQAGEVNYIQNPSAQTDLTNWASSGVGVTVVRDTTLADLPRSSLTITGIKITPVSGTTDYAYTRFTVGAADKGKKLKIQWAQKAAAGFANGDLVLEMWTNSASNYGGSYTQLQVEQPAIGPSSFVMMTAFDTTNADYYELRIRRAAGTSALVLSDVVVGPGILASVPNITSWQAYTPNLIGFGTPTGLNFVYRLVGEEMEIQGSFTVDTPAGVQPEVGLPSGYTFNSGLIPTNRRSLVGNYFRLPTGGVVNIAANVGAMSTDLANPTTLMIVSDSQATNYASQTASAMFTAGDGVSLWARVPINEVQPNIFATNTAIEYVSNSSVVDNDDHVSFAYGSRGSEFPPLTSAHDRWVKFTTPILPSDVILFQTTTDGGATWQNSGAATAPCDNYIIIGGVDQFGANVVGAVVDAYTVNVLFGSYAKNSNATYGATPGTAWSTISGSANTRWRVIKVGNPLAVGFATATPTQAGLVAPYSSEVDAPISSGTYTPTVTVLSNIDASSNSFARWTKVGKMVTVFGYVDIDPTASGASTAFELTLPVASAVVAATLIGQGSGAGLVSNPNLQIYGSSGKAQVAYLSTATTNQTLNYSFMYEVI